jgi:hypothetical protein
MCLQGLNLSSIQDSALNHDLALLQPVMNAVGNHWGFALHKVKHKHSGMNDLSLSYIKMVLKTE